MEHDKPLFERRHYKALCRAAHRYWSNGGPNLLEHLARVLSAFDNFSEVRFRRMWERLSRKESDNELPDE